MPSTSSPTSLRSPRTATLPPGGRPTQRCTPSSRTTGAVPSRGPWPRNAGNDPFWVASLDLAERLSRAAGQPVIVGFNEFCAPSLDEALDQAAARGPVQVRVVTPMMTRGGEHAESDIPAAVEAARGRHPGVAFVYTWPFPVSEVARFLAEQMAVL